MRWKRERETRETEVPSFRHERFTYSFGERFGWLSIAWLILHEALQARLNLASPSLAHSSRFLGLIASSPLDLGRTRLMVDSYVHDHVALPQASTRSRKTNGSQFGSSTSPTPPSLPNLISYL